jgi:hypothetical protein
VDPLMPVKGLSDQRRLPRSMKIRLGIRTKNAQGIEYPKETDFFVLNKEDFASPDIFTEVLGAYGQQPKQLKMLIPFEVDAVNPVDGDEIVFNLHNRSYGAGHGLRCKGDGGSADTPGTAVSTDIEWAKRIGEFTGDKPEDLGSGRYKVQCLGRDCCKYNAPGRDGKESPGGAAACKQMLVFRAFLLHPTEDPMSPDYCRPFGIAELASSSYNTMVDIRSGLEMLRPFAKRTAAVPFWLVRHPRTTNHDGKRQVHYTCMVIWSAKEVQAAGLTSPSEVFLPAALRKELKLLGEPDFDSVRDLLPAGNGHTETPKLEAPTPEVTDTTASDRDEVVGAAAEDAGDDPDDALPSVDEAAEQRQLTQAERDELKALCGQRQDPDNPKAPFTPEAISKLQEMAQHAHASLGTEPADGQGLLSSLQVRHSRWIKEQLAAEGVAVQEAMV